MHLSATFADHQQPCLLPLSSHIKVLAAVLPMLMLSAALTSVTANAASSSQPTASYAARVDNLVHSSLQLDEMDDDQLIQERVLSNPKLAQATRLFLECTQVQVDAARLACFDKVAETGRTPSFTNDKKPIDLPKTFSSTLRGQPQAVLVDSSNETTQLSHPQGTQTSGTVETDQGASTDSSSSVWTPVQNTNNTTASTTPINTLATPRRIVSNGSNNDAQILAHVGVTADDVGRYSPLSMSYDLHRNDQRGTWSARPHNPMYMLPLFFHGKPNRNPSTPNQDVFAYTPNEMRAPELKLQVSVKTKVAEDLFDTQADLWFGYTQQSHWQIYNEDNSRPFRATDYEPEIFLTQPVRAELPFGGRLRMLGVGAVHHSNGQDDPLSRSWNRLYVIGGAEWDKLTIVPKIWARINTDTSSKPDDNPDITDYYGYGEVKFLYDFEKKRSLGGTLRYNPVSNKGAAQLDFIYPFGNNINGYVQLFHGYGESLVDYNHKDTAIGLGVMLNDWRGL